MPKKITIIQGHPDPANNRFCHALEMAYIEGAKNGGHAVKRIDVANLDFPLLRTREEFEHGDPPPGIVDSGGTRSTNEDSSLVVTGVSVADLDGDDQSVTLSASVA